MGLFGTRKDSSKEVKEGHAHDTAGSPSDALSKRSKGRIRQLGNLFVDEGEHGNRKKTTSPGATDVGNLSAPTIDMDDVEVPAAVVVQSVAPVPAGSETLEDDRRKLSSVPATSIVQSQHHNLRTQKSLSRQNSIMRRANSISRMSQRDSIKRSVSRKIARSESRLQGLHLSDSPRNQGESKNLGTVSFSCPTGSSEDEADYSSQRQVPATAEAQDFETAYDEDDLFLVEEATKKDFGSQVGPSKDLRLSGEQYAHEAGQEALAESGPKVSTEDSSLLVHQPSNPSKSGKARRRPPPLVGANTEKSCTDSTSDWPHTTVFGKDGGFATRGFKITAEGMVGKPELATRQDSDHEAEGETPQSDPSLIMVRSLKEFRAGPTIGAGAGGRVYLAEHVPSQKTMAMKVVNVYDREKRNQLLKELETLCTHVSRHLVRFYGAFYDGSGAVHIALEFMDHGCLSTFVQTVGAIPEQIVQMIAIDCLRGLRFLHRNHVLHRDFKTANILLSRRLCCAKLSDFGLARDMNPGVSRVETFVGTVAYMSPERLQGSKYTYASDIWALGVSVAECLLGRYPFSRPQNYFDYIEATMTTNLWSSFEQTGVYLSEGAKDFITQCTHTDPASRQNSEELLQHPWLFGVRKDKEIFGSWLDKCRIISMRVTPKHSNAQPAYNRK